MEHRTWWHPYRITDEQFISDFLDERIAKDIQFREGIPTDSKSLDRFLWRISGGLTNAHTATPEARAQVLENIKHRYENPQIKKARRKESYPGIAIVDFGHVPGEWQTGRGGWHFKSLGTNSYDLAPADITRGFQLAHKAFPEATLYLVTARVFYGGSSHHSEYQLDSHGRLYYVHNVSYYYSRETHPMDKILSGEITPENVEMDGVMQSSVHSPTIINMRPLQDPVGYKMDYAQE